MILHEMCSVSNDVALNSPIHGASTVRKLLPGTWTRTCITTDCGGSGGGTASCFGAGASGKGVTVKELQVKEGGSRYMPEQKVIVVTGGM